MREGEAGFAGPTHRAGSGRSQLGGLFAKRSILLGGRGSGVLAGRRRPSRGAGVLLVLAGALTLALFLGTVPASAHIQWEPKYTFGPDGTSGTAFNAATVNGVQQAEGRLYVHDMKYPEGHLYAFHRTGPGELTPIGSPFPLTAHWVGEGELAVDNTANTSKGNVYLALGDFEEVPSVEAWLASGTALSAFEPGTGNKCGAAVDNEGHLWIANQGSGLAEVFDPTGGEPIKTVPLKLTESYVKACNLAFDPSTGDLYAGFDFGNGVWRYTAASNFETKEHVPGSGTGFCCQRSAKIAIDANSNRLYLFNTWSSGSYVQVFNLTTLQELEKFAVPSQTQIHAIAVDEASDTLFIPFTPEGVYSEGGKYLQEWRRVNAPIVTTGPQVGNEIVSGSVALDGAGNVTGCWAEYGTKNEPEKFTKSATSCSGTLPYEADQSNVTVDLTGALEGEKTYYYRLAATNGEGTGRGAIKTFVPHWVSEIKTLPPSNEGLEGRTEERLKGSYQGTEEETEYWFEYKEGTGSCGETCPNKTEVKKEGKTTGLTTVNSVAKALKAGKTYSYRFVAKNARGESKGQMEQFTTLPAVAGVVTKPASEPTSTTARVLNGSLNPEGIATHWYFEWGKDTSYGQSNPLPPGTATSSAGDENVHEELTDLEPGTTYHFRLVATNEFGTTYGNDEVFSTPQTPSIISFNATHLTASSADLVATINPNGYETEFFFEYGLTKNYGKTAPIPVGKLEEDLTASQPVDVPISNLEEKTYHFKLIAHNRWGTVETEDQTFNFNVPEACPNQILRQETGSAYLPDCRAYELVSARNANGTAVSPHGPTSPYADGKMAYAGFLNVIPESGEPQNSAFGLEPYMATRKQDGWVTKYIGVPGSVGIGQSSSPGNEYGEVSGYNCWNWEEEKFSCGVQGTYWPSAIPADKSLSHMLVWNREQYGIAGGLRDGNDGPEVYSNEGKMVQKLPTNFDEIEGADTVMNEGGWIGSARISPDYTHYVFSSIKTAFAPGGLTESPGSVYDDELATGKVTIVSKTESGEDIPLDPLSGLGEEFLRVPAVSDSGTHILISSAAPPAYGFTKFTQNQHLYMAVNEGNGEYKHWDISVDKNGKNVGVEYKAMTPDGSKVFFVTDNQMTADDTDTSRDLYMWSEAAARKGEPPLTRLSASDNTAGNTDSCSASWTQKCNVKMILIYPGGFSGGDNLFDTYTAAETGEIYFYSPERLDGARGFPNKRNLYVYRNGKAQYVATLEPNQPVERVDVSPDGKHMAFITKTKVTPYENAGYSEMYLYDPAARTIKCVSCRPDGQPPTSDVEGSMNGWFMTFDGRTFWSTRDALVPRDANENVDVYEFTEGRPQLITPGTSNDGETFLQKPGLVGVSGDGRDVFFATFATLVSQDENGDQYKFYDARVNGGFPPEPLSPPCAAADECHGEESPAPARPEIGSSAALGNGGNYHFTKKHRGKHRKHRASCRKGKKKTCRSHRSGQKRSRHG